MYRLDEKYCIETFKSLLAIDSTTGKYDDIQACLKTIAEGLGFSAYECRKGGLVVDLGGEGHAVAVTAHVDDIGLFVRKVNDDGTLKATRVGGLYANNCTGENVRIYTRDGAVFSGTICRVPNSIHVSDEEIRSQAGEWEKNVCIVLDKDVKCAADTRALGIETGDIVALEPRFTMSDGYIKSRFVDNKACAAVMLSFMKYVADNKIKLSRKVYAYFTVYEEISCGVAYMPDDVEDVISLDIAPTGCDQNSDEHKVTIFAKDATVPYHWGLTNEVRTAAIKGGVDFVMDVFTPHYGTDATAAFKLGKDWRIAAFGPGTANSHGYERTHIDGLKNTYAVLAEYLLQ